MKREGAGPEVQKGTRSVLPVYTYYSLQRDNGGGWFLGDSKEVPILRGGGECPTTEMELHLSSDQREPWHITARASSPR